MARTSKTVIGGGSGEQSDRMMRASESGRAGIERSRERIAREEADRRDFTARQLTTAGQAIDAQRAREAQMAQQSEQFNAQMAQDESQFSRGLAQREDQMELDAAKAGFERNDGQPSGGEQGQSLAGGDLSGEMQADEGAAGPGGMPMDPESQQRLQQQGQQRLEMEPSGRWRPTAERTRNMEREQRRADFQADTERMRAMAYRDQVGTAAQKALAEGNTDVYQEHAKLLASLPNGEQKRFDRLMKGEVNANDWSEMAKIAGENSMDPSISADIKAKQFTPRVQAFMRAQVAKSALESIVLSKGSTRYLDIDETNPMYSQFIQMRGQINAFMSVSPALAKLAFIRSTDDKMRFLNVLAASQTLMGMARASAGGPGGMTPATAAPMEQQGAMGGGGAPMRQHSAPPPGGMAGADAARGVRAGGGSPQEALEAGQAAQPTAQFGQPRPRPNPTDLRRSGL